LPWYGRKIARLALNNNHLIPKENTTDTEIITKIEQYRNRNHSLQQNRNRNQNIQNTSETEFLPFDQMQQDFLKETNTRFFFIIKKPELP